MKLTMSVKYVQNVASVPNLRYDIIHLNANH